MTGTGYSESHIEMFRSQGAYPKIALSFLSFFPARGHSAGKTAAAPSTFSRWQVSVLSPSWSLSLMWCRLTECLWGVLPSKYQRLNQVGLSKKKKKVLVQETEHFRTSHCQAGQWFWIERAQIAMTNIPHWGLIQQTFTVSVLEARSSIWRCGQGSFPLRLWGSICSMPLSYVRVVGRQSLSFLEMSLCKILSSREQTECPCSVFHKMSLI